MKGKWIIKALIQKTISYLPWSHRINVFFQKHITGGFYLDDGHFGQKLQHAEAHLEYLRAHGRPDPRSRILELGTGWYPVVPVLFYLTGAGEVFSIDIRPWMTRQTQQNTILKYREWKERGLLQDLWPQVDPERWDLLMQVADHPGQYSREELNKLMGLHPLLQDARKLDLQQHSMDFICSNNTFEHIPESVLRDILREFKRVLKPGGLMSHFIDMSDHFAHSDSHITIYNFLRFSKNAWAIMDNSIQPQNRMRLRDYRELYALLDIPSREADVRPGDPKALDSIRVHGEFASYSREELAVSHATMLSLFKLP